MQTTFFKKKIFLISTICKQLPDTVLHFLHDIATKHPELSKEEMSRQQTIQTVASSIWN